MAFQAQIIRVSQVYELFSTQSIPKKWRIKEGGF
jgi:hypothetical protein